MTKGCASVGDRQTVAAARRARGHRTVPTDRQGHLEPTQGIRSELPVLRPRAERLHRAQLGSPRAGRMALACAPEVEIVRIRQEGATGADDSSRWGKSGIDVACILFCSRRQDCRPGHANRDGSGKSARMCRTGAAIRWMPEQSGIQDSGSAWEGTATTRPARPVARHSSKDVDRTGPCPRAVLLSEADVNRVVALGP